MLNAPRLKKYTRSGLWLGSLLWSCQTPVAPETTRPTPVAQNSARVTIPAAPTATPIPVPTAIPTAASPAVILATPTPFPSPPLLPMVTVSTLAGHETSGDVEGSATEARFFSPTGLVYTDDGRLLVADMGNYRLRQISADGQVKAFAGNHLTGSTFGDVSRVRFTAPAQLVRDSLGYFYLVDRTIPILKKISPTGYTEAWVSNESFFSMYPQPEFGVPEQIAIDKQSNLWVTTDTRLWRITPSGQSTVVLGSKQGFPAPLKAISGLAVTEAGLIWISDAQTHRVFCFRPNGELTPVAGSTVGFADGQGDQAKFNNPQGLLAGPDGMLYVADTGNFRIRRVTPSGQVQTLAGQGTAGLVDGPGTTAKFKLLRAMTWAPNGDLIVSDSTTLRRLKWSTPTP